MSDTQKHNKPNVPNLRFPEFSGEWKTKKIGQDCTINMCKRIFANQTSEIGDVPFYKIGTIGGLPDSYISRDLFEEYKSKYNYPHKGEVMITCAGTVGKTIVFDGEDAYYQDSNIVWLSNPKQLYINSFLNYCLSRVNWNKLNSTTITRIYNDNLRELTINYPSIKEQEKIVSVLSLIDKRIDIQNKVIKDLIRIKESITRKLLRQKDESSRIVTLGEITEIVSRRNKDRKNYPMYSVTNDRGFIPQTEQFEDREMVGDDIGNYKIIHKDEIAYNPARINVGSIAQYTEEKPCMISSLYVCIRAKKGINSKWLIRVLKSEQLINYYNLYAEGGVRLYLFYPNFSRIKVLLPSNTMQRQIADTLKTIENKIELESSILKDYILSKEALLDSMFI